MPLVLDTNVVRDLGAGRLEPRHFDVVQRAGVSIHLSDTAASELAHALLEGRFFWEQWMRAKAVVVDIADPGEPILLGGGQGLLRAGLIPRKGGPDTSDVAEAIAAYAAGWNLLVGATSLDQLRNMQFVPPGADASYQFEGVSEAMGQEKTKWIDDFREFDGVILAGVPDLPARLPARGDSAEALEMFVKVLKDGMDDLCPNLMPTASTRLDAFLRVHALLRLRSLRRKDQYNPSKDANDALDHFLLKYLAHPAAICTSDGGIAADVEAAKSWQRKWIVTPDDLLRADMVAELIDLVWPAEPHNKALNLTGADAPAG